MKLTYGLRVFPMAFITSFGLLIPTLFAQIPYVDSVPHRSQMVQVEPDVKLEVLDFGGSGRPIILLAGMGNTAHIYDNFAPKLIQSGHVYAITRRGFGSSSAPQTGYSANRLGDDVLAVMDALKLERPILIGHSLGGEELSSIGSRYPDRVAGLIYLDAGYTYAFYDAAHGNYVADLPVIRKELDDLAQKPNNPDLMNQAAADLPLFLKNLQSQVAQQSIPPPPGCPRTTADGASFSAMRVYMAGRLGGLPPEAELHQTFTANPDGSVGAPLGHPFVGNEIFSGFDRYVKIPVPILAFFAIPHSIPGCKGTTATITNSPQDVMDSLQAEAFEKGLSSAKVVRIPNANHYIFISNQVEVLTQIEAFLHTLAP